jgi:two-component system chemotaxis response regulator CheB
VSAVRVAIVDDSRFVREALRRLLADHPRIAVAGVAATGEELVANLEQWRPDVVTLDLAMPGWGGLATLDRLREAWPVPVIVLATHTGSGAGLAFEALERGAVDVLDKEAYSLVDFDALRTVLVERILAVAGAPVRAVRAGHAPGSAAAAALAAPAVPGAGRLAVVLVGASTGGPPAVEALLAALGPVPAPPVVVVQHMPRGFTRAFAARLDRALPLHVHEAEDAMPLRAGHVYVGPAGQDILVSEGAAGPQARLMDGPSGALYRPSVDALFRSALPLGPAALAVLLTGMGRDGVDGMRALRGAGAHTIAQDEATCVVYGMPRGAVEAGAAAEVLPLDLIGARVRDLVSGTYDRPRERR